MQIEARAIARDYLAQQQGPAIAHLRIELAELVPGLCPFEKEDQFKEKIEKLFDVLTKTREALNSVKPTEAKDESEAPQATYNAIENHFATINELKGDLTGLFEQQTTNFGGDHAA